MTTAWRAEPLRTVATGEVSGVASAPDGATLAVVRAGRLVVYDEYGRTVGEAVVDAAAATGSVAETRWTPDGAELFVVAGGVVTVLDTDTWQRCALPEPLAGVTSASALAIAAGGDRVAVGLRGGGAILLDRTSGVVRTLRGADPVTALAWRPGTLQLAVATGRSVQLWDADRLTMAGLLGGRYAAVQAVTWSPDGGVLAIAEARGVVLVDAAAGAETATARLPAPATLAFSRDGSRLLAGTRNTGVTIFDRSLAALTTLSADCALPGTLDVNAAGLVTVRQDAARVRIWRLPDTVLPDRPERGHRRWANRMGVTVGRALPPLRDLAGVVRRPEVLDAGRPDAAGPPTAWSPDGRFLFYESAPGRLACRTLEAAEPRWETQLEIRERGRHDIAVSGRHLVAAARVSEERRVSKGRSARKQHGGGGLDVLDVLDVQDGRLLATLPGGQSPVLAPGDVFRLAVPEPGGDPRQILVYEDLDTEPRRLPVAAGVWRLAWSPDGSSLAAAGQDGEVVLWDTRSWRRRRGPAAPGVALCRLAWSPDGTLLAAAPGSRGGPIVVWETATWTVRARLGDVGGPGWAPALAWSPDGLMLVVPAAGHGVTVAEVWDVVKGGRIAELRPPAGTGHLWALAWSPLGDRILCTHSGGPLVCWELTTGGAVSSPAPDLPLPYDPELLATLGALTARVTNGVPLSLLVSLLAVTGAGERLPAELAGLAETHGATALRALRWPVRSRLGLALLLAERLPPYGRYAAPQGAPEGRLRAALRRALAGPAVVPQVPGIPMAALADAFAEVDERLLALLAILGPEAVAAEPTLPIRLRRRRLGVDPLTDRQRALLEVRMTVAEGGSLQGRGGGEGVAGLARHGDINRLLPTQLALPQKVQASRHARSELLYRTRQGRLPPGPSAAILVLDDTPPTHGAVGVTLRIAAHVIGATLLRLGRACVLLPLGDATAVRFLTDPAEFAYIWTSGTLRSPPPVTASERVMAATARLSDPLAGPPQVILLTYLYADLPPWPRCRVLRVHYPGRPPRRPSPPGTFVLPPDPQPDALRAALAGLLTGPD